MKQMVSVRLDPTLLARSKRAAAQAGTSWTAWVEEAIRRRLDRENPMQCAVCGRVLDPQTDPVVYLGFGQRYDGKPGPGWVLALCGAMPGEVDSREGSLCVDEARQRLGDQPVWPCTYEDWAGAEVRKDKGVAVVETYRAAIYRHPEGEEQVMTAPEHADLADEELIDLAMKEANSAGLIGDAWPQVPDAEFRRRLYVGEWAER